MSSNIRVEPVVFPGVVGNRLRASVSNVDIEHLTDVDFAAIREALFTHQVLVFKNQSHVTPKAQYELTHRFDPAAASKYGHGDTTTGNKRSILHPDLRTIPHQPQVQVIGHGRVDEYEGLRDLRLKHPHHRTFHATAVPDHEDHYFTRFYRWHIDAALYGADLAPPVVTTLLAVKVPGGGRRQTCRYEDGSGDELDVPLGTTAFVNGEAMYNSLSEADKEFARTTKVEYAPHPYVWMSSARSRSDGLGLVSEGLQTLPMCWRNPVTGRLALQVHPSAVRALHLGDGTVIDDLERVRETVHRLQRPGIAPRRVYAHDWREGDLVLFHNRGVLHSVVGAFAEDEVRLLRQCNIAARPREQLEEQKVAAATAV
ncbi:alpha-ketoglutarate dependent xanthine dioxygenase [Apiospora hydei]|uniref:Alpha-ketoglutarate dependent xanthine dioxygenase n=1 Tax=Apiospora hydei TaxID=1337664 RepID=A0ABR1V533_9PEZI